MAVSLSRLIERNALALDPGVSLQFAVFFANTDAQPRGYPLPAEQPPQCERFRQTRRMNHAVPVRGVDHVRGQGCSIPSARKNSACAGRPSALNLRKLSSISGQDLQQAVFDEVAQQFGQVFTKQFRLDIVFRKELLVGRVDVG